MTRATGSNGEAISIEGVLRFAITNAQSKSEHSGPIIVTDAAVCYPVYLKGDNPFSHDALRQYTDQQVRGVGVWKRQTVVLRELVRVTPEQPQQEPPHKSTSDSDNPSRPPNENL